MLTERRRFRCTALKAILTVRIPSVRFMEHDLEEITKKGVEADHRPAGRGLYIFGEGFNGDRGSITEQRG